MHTFSSLVDSVVALTSRPDKRDTIALFANTVIRDMHRRPGNSDSTNSVIFAENLVEDVIDVSAVPFVWQIPGVANFMQVHAVKPVASNESFVERTPASLQSDFMKDFTGNNFYYRSGSSLVFSGLHVFVGNQLRIAYVQYLPSLSYIAPAQRKVTAVDGEYVLIAGGTPPESDLKKETNWMLARHPYLIVDGIMAKFYTLVGNEAAGRQNYSNFTAALAQMQLSESTL